MDFDYLESNRHGNHKYLEAFIKLSHESFFQFEDSYNNFVLEMKKEDGVEGETLPIFSQYGYPSLKEIIQNDWGEYLTFVIDEFLFTEFFSLIAKTPSNKFIARVKGISFEDEHVSMKILYLKR